ncbi:MAG: NusA N-terminal domain-containing protein, partial [Pseudomonadota bacterium]
MSREILLLVDALAREKSVEKEIVFTALEMALASATKKRFQEDTDARVSINRQTGEYQSFRRWLVVEDDAVEESARQISLSEAAKIDTEIQPGGYVEKPLEPIEFGRI